MPGGEGGGGGATTVPVEGPQDESVRAKWTLSVCPMVDDTQLQNPRGGGTVQHRGIYPWEPLKYL